MLQALVLFDKKRRLSIMNVEHPDITHAMLTGHPRGNEPPQVALWQAKAIPHDQVFPFEREDE